MSVTYRFPSVSGRRMDSPSWYMKDIGLVAVTTRDALLLIDHDGSTLRHRTDHPAEWSALLQILANPAKASEVAAGRSSIPDLDDQFWNDLFDRGLVSQSSEAAPLEAARDTMFSDNKGFHLVPREPVCGHLIVACTGSIVAGLMGPTLLSLLYSRFQRNLDVILTDAARKFMTVDFLESYGIRTWSDPFERRDGIHVAHVQLARSADCLLVLPASADSLRRLAEGACTDLLSMAVVASHAPVVVSPVMNDAMWNNAAVQRNVQTLRADGKYVIEPTVIFGAADVASQGRPMFGGHGTLWTGPRSLMTALEAVMAHAGERTG